MTTAAEKLKAKYKWEEIHVPRAWHPRPGEELVGYYGGKTVRNGRYGQYEVVLVHIPYKGTMTVSGTGIVQLVDSSMIKKGHPVQIKFIGLEDLEDDKSFKRFKLLVAEGEPIAEEGLPGVKTQ